MRIRIPGYRKMSLPIFLMLSLCSFMSISGAYAQTYQLSDGDVVTCIPIEEQPSLQYLTNPTYNSYPTTIINPGSTTRFPDRASIAHQTFELEVGACADGTIPVLEDYLLGTSSYTSRRLKTKGHSQSLATANSHHEYAIAVADSDGVTTPSYKGTEMVTNIWDPFVESPHDFSLAQLWITKGSYANVNLNTVEAGYQVYGLRNYSRLFVYWTADAYTKTGCYDLECPGFVQVSNKVLLRGSFKYTSAEQGKLFEIKLQVFQDGQTSDWWLLLNDEIVGYWPSSIFTADGLQGPAEEINWGGEVFDYDVEDGIRHTTTDMGSGLPASDGYGRAAYMRNMQYVDANYNSVDSPFYVSNTSAPCYSVATTDSANTIGWGSFFYFGGPGYNSQCLTDAH